MSIMKRIVKYAAVMALAGGMPWLVMAQPYLVPQGVEYRIAGPQPGDQTHPQAAINRAGGVLVWQDNASTNGAQRVKALRLDGNLNAAGPVVPVDEFAPGDQENPQVALLSNGDGLVVWQGGEMGSQRIYGQNLSMSDPTIGAPFMVNTYLNASNQDQITPSVAALPDGNAFVAWASRDQDGDMLGVYARRVSATGEPIGAEIAVNQFTSFNQRSPDVAALNNGTVLVAWVSEQQRGPRTLDIYGRLFSLEGLALGKEFLMVDATNMCANPTITATADGGIILAWSQKNLKQTTNGWDIYARVFDASCTPKGPSFIVNSRVYGDQVGPKLASVGEETLVVWTAMAQDGDYQGVYGQYVDLSGQLLGSEFQVNTTSIRNQLEPTVVSDGYRHILAVWTSYIVGAIDFDLMSQQFVTTQVAAEIKLTLTSGAQGLRMNWNSEPGTTYQVQYSSNFLLWKNLGTPRVAAGVSEFIGIDPSNTTSFYRVVQMPKSAN
jgi:hypothetical protein